MRIYDPNTILDDPIEEYVEPLTFEEARDRDAGTAALIAAWSFLIVGIVIALIGLWPMVPMLLDWRAR